MNGSAKYNGEHVYTLDDFRYAKDYIGSYVSDSVVEDAMNCLPPACMRSDCSQIGEPYSHCQDPETGKWRATYATFKKVAEGIWQYCGNCFRCENVERETIHIV